MTYTSGGAPFRMAELVVESYRLLFQNWRNCLVALALPAAIDTLVRAAFTQNLDAMRQQQTMTSEQALEQLMGEESVLRMVAMLVVNVIAITLFAVSWHRLSLLGEKPRLVPKIGSEHTRFAWLSLALIFGTTVIALSGVTLAFAGPAGLVVLFAFIAIVVVYVKLSMMFPAAALDAPCSMGDSWRMTKGTSLSLFWAIVLGSFPILLVLLLVSVILTGIVAAIFQGTILGTWVLLAIQSVLSYLPWAITIGIVSIAYSKLAGPIRRPSLHGGGSGA